MDKEHLTMYPNAMPQQEAAMTYLFTYASPIRAVAAPGQDPQSASSTST